VHLLILEDLKLTSYQITGTAICCAYLTVNPHFASPTFRHWRASFYAGIGLSSIVFIVHGLLIYGWELQKSRMSLDYMGWVAVFNLLGAVIYAARVSLFHSRCS
jgi:adiponectin receptor